MKFKNILTALTVATVLTLTGCGGEKDTVNNGGAAPVGLAATNETTTETITSRPISEEPDVAKKEKKPKSTTPFTGQPVNINTATAEELVKALKGTGVGEAKVKNIIDYRTEHNGFKSIDELNAVKGIGDKTLEKMRSRVTLSDTSDKQVIDNQKNTPAESKAVSAVN